MIPQVQRSPVSTRRTGFGRLIPNTKFWAFTLQSGAKIYLQDQFWHVLVVELARGS